MDVGWANVRFCLAVVNRKEITEMVHIPLARATQFLSALRLDGRQSDGGQSSEQPFQISGLAERHLANQPQGGGRNTLHATFQSIY